MANTTDQDYSGLFEKICNEIDELLGVEQYKAATKAIKLAIKDFYDSYTPRFYRRTGKLASFAHPGFFGPDGAFSFDLGAEFLVGEYDSHEKNPANAKYIYLLVFELGYHGGAISGQDPDYAGGRFHPDPPTPRWRRPEKYSYPFWGREAIKADVSPRNSIVNYWNDFINKDLPKIRQKLYIDLIKKYYNELKGYVEQIQADNAKYVFKQDIQ